MTTMTPEAARAAILARDVPQGYLYLGGGYAYAPLGYGLVLRAPDGREAFFQGDGELAIRETLDALSECDESIIDHVATVALDAYFD